MAFVIKLDPDLDKAVAVLAAQRGWSKAEVVKIAVRAFVLNYSVERSEDEDSSRV